MKFPPSVVLFFLVAPFCAPLAVYAEDSKIDAEQLAFFENKVRPLFVKHCYACHSAEAKEVKGGLLLDSRDGWETGGDSGTAVEPGNVAGSLLLTAVRYEDFEMPPKGKMPDTEIAVLERWVEMGAPDPREGQSTAKKSGEIDLEKAREFWAFQAPKKHHAPAVQENDWPRDDVDRFLLARLEVADLKPAADADPHTWLRRVTYDLTGLPPSPAEIADFVNDPSRAARAAVVDRLLASRQFGEHWGRHWLDVARYADSNGGDFNATFYNAWRYRNYVIDALNDDKPFDQFVREQVAGDLLPFDNDKQRGEQLIATGFLAIGTKMLSERDKEKLYLDVVDEQVDTVGRAFLGLTLGCARCHDHKFDPISTEDYYGLAGIFHSTETLYGESQQYVSDWREWELPLSPQLAAAREAYEKQRDALTGELAEAKKIHKAAKDALSRSPKTYPGIIVDDTQAEIVGNWKASTFSPNYVGKGYIHDDKMDLGKKSVTFRPKIPAPGTYEVRIAYPSNNGRATNVPVTVNHADGATEIKLNQEESPPVDKLFKPLGRFRFEAGKSASVTITNKDTNGYVIADAIQFVSLEELEKDNPKPAVAKEPTGDQKKEVAALAKQVKDLEARLKTLEAGAPEVPKAIGVREQETPADCEICIRGEHKNRGPAVPRGFVSVLREEYVSNRQQSGRRELAEWIADPENPLTARVIVNRVWHHLMGRGIVRTVDNFGQLGERPTHPELLDRLAIDFVNDGWSMKKLTRRIVLSRAYGMSSAHDESAYLADPENALLWRARRKRLSAESIRDTLLVVSQKLDFEPGRSPVKGLGKLAVGNERMGGSGGNVYRLSKRCVYMPSIRNDLPELLTVFDFADPDVVVGRRPTTTVPAQALMLMNDPFVRASAEQTAKRVMGENSDPRQRVQHAYLLTIGREPASAEVEQAIKFLGNTKDEKAAWSRFVQALFASTESRILN